MSDGKFYAAFEDLHRGSRELIQSRQKVYLPFVHGVLQLHPGSMVTDLGCGRGEWLELLRQEGVSAQGVDLDAGMLQSCRALGLDVRQGDAIEFIQRLPDQSQAVVTAFHVAEHLPFETLHTLAVEALRVLLPGGLLILETPNPENLAVGTSGFYTDPTHERPLPPPLLAFLPEFHGFGRVKVLRLQQGAGLEEPQAPVTLLDVLAGVSPDYAVIAQKPVAAGADNPATLDAAFSEEHGVSLNDLAQRHEQQWAGRVHQVHVEAEAARNAALAAQGATTHAFEQLSAQLRHVVDLVTALENKVAYQVSALEHNVVDRVSALEHNVVDRASALELKVVDRVSALEQSTQGQLAGVSAQVSLAEANVLHQVAAVDQKVTDQVWSLQQELWASRQQLSAMYQSTSWRLTAPIRWVGGQGKALKTHRPRERTRRMAGRLARGTAQAAVRLLERHPRARRMAVDALRATGLESFARRMLARFAAAVATAQSMPGTSATTELTPAAKRIHEALRRAVDAHAQAPAPGEAKRKS